MMCYVDADHAGDKLTQRSWRGILVFINRSPILWSSKKQRSIKTSSFGSEFMALKAAVEIICGLRYKVRFMGIPIDKETHVMVDNMSMVYNTTRLESTLKKKSNSLAYHFIRESTVAKEIKIQHVGAKDNMSDMLSKSQSGPDRKQLAQMLLM